MYFFAVDGASLRHPFHMRISMKADHMWFTYLSNSHLDLQSLGEFRLVRGTMTVSFGTEMRNHVTVKKCGARLFYLYLFILFFYFLISGIALI